jgi:anaerobic selenocysteine-containing dehydrogenase
LEAYVGHKAFWEYKLPEVHRYYRMANRGYLEWAHQMKMVPSQDGIILNLYSEPLQTFRLAGQGLWPGKKPHQAGLRQRLTQYFSPVPIWYEPLEDDAREKDAFPLRIITQRPMTHYHSWGSHNAWLRQLLNENPLYMNPHKALELGLKEGQWVWIESRIGRMTGKLRFSDAVEPGTVWTWNAIAKGPGSWALDPQSPEVTRAILINHIIPDRQVGSDGYFNNDPITGQAGWYDARVRIYPSEVHQVWPQMAPRQPASPSPDMHHLAYQAGILEGRR